jgi:hypothetical protein
MQDNSLAAQKPHLALRDEVGGIWKDASGLYWVDPASQEVWDYNAQISKEIIDLGFDELNFDYVRFPSDGTLQEIKYPFWSGVTPKHEIMKQFFAYLTSKIKEYNPQIVLSVDLFAYNFLTGMKYDSVIGQHVEDAALYFDVLAPMIYPSHYARGHMGYKNPAAFPYEVVMFSMESGIERLVAKREAQIVSSSVESSTISDSRLAISAKFRPWLQDFDLGADYDEVMVRKQIQAVYDAARLPAPSAQADGGQASSTPEFVLGWMLWNPSNIYSISGN